MTARDRIVRTREGVAKLQVNEDVFFVGSRLSLLELWVWQHARFEHIIAPIAGQLDLHPFGPSRRSVPCFRHVVVVRLTFRQQPNNFVEMTE